MKIFLVKIKEVHCGCGLEAAVGALSFKEKQDAEDFCEQFNAINKLPPDKDGEPMFESREAAISEIHLFEKKVKYELDVTVKV